MLKLPVRSAKARLREFIPDRTVIELEFLKRHGRRLRLNPPTTLCEKIMFRKLYDRDPRMPEFADKVRAKELVAQILGPEWVIPNLWAGSRLPPREQRCWPTPYVLKAGHGCGWNIFVRSEAEQNWDAIEEETGRWLAETYGRRGREWLYTKIAHRLLAEPYLGAIQEDPTDYKLMVFGGKTAYVQVDVGRSTDHRQYFYDLDWNRQKWDYVCPFLPGDVPPPASLDKMIWGANRLGEGFPFVRIDLYEIEEKPLFGEATFYPNGGGTAFKPEEVERRLGALWPT